MFIDFLGAGAPSCGALSSAVKARSNLRSALRSGFSSDWTNDLSGLEVREIPGDSPEAAEFFKLLETAKPIYS